MELLGGMLIGTILCYGITGLFGGKVDSNPKLWPVLCGQAALIAILTATLVAMKLCE